jgi:2-polyprenyl-6-methoxyphenol hydroxylase-like FAD-dependent oxidoreductase
VTSQLIMIAHQASTPSGNGAHDVAIVGGGPVGLLLANCLGQSGLRVIVLERRIEPLAHSAAIGITPPSLHILERLGLLHDFLRQGVKVRDCFIHGMSGRLGCVSFRDIPDKFPWVLSLPQSATVALLQQRLADYPSVTLRLGVEVAFVEQQDEGVIVGYHDRDCAKEAPHTILARWAVGCDGARSAVRELLGVRAVGKSYARHFVMGDFVDRTRLGDEAHLYFKPEGSVESFPLPSGLRRWVVQTAEPMRHVPPAFISHVVKARTGFDVPQKDQLNESTFTPRRFDASRYHVGRVVLCGDAAHVMSPAGGQGMNTGFADAEFLAEVLSAVLLRKAPAAPLLASYERCRRAAARTAILRAEWGMWLGTWRGRLRSRFRDFFIRRIMCRWPMAPHTGPFYAMLTIPYNTLERVPPSLLNYQTS